ncbi:hypothetical protein AAFF_G00298070 [Aldrovandia affinis]|uniref:Uncharacterized protein n=1 Tax=Aldrovandia affinis TaxID=143900 RepID=A0AAD7R9E1_9TELE|nr:hypothetical protein AAFF_G00298070 [Aldrovandia affinis]
MKSPHVLTLTNRAVLRVGLQRCNREASSDRSLPLPEALQEEMFVKNRDVEGSVACESDASPGSTKTM